MSYVPNSIQIAMHSDDPMPVNFGAGSVLIKVDVGEVWFVDLNMEWKLWTPAGGGGGTDQLTADELASIHAVANALNQGNPVIEKATFDAHTGDYAHHVSPDERIALDLTPQPLGAANPVVDSITLLAHEGDFELHMGSDQNAAFDNANSPNGMNPLATMNDIPAPAPPATPPHESIPTIEKDIAGLTPSKVACQEAFDDYGLDASANAVFFIIDTFGTLKPNYLVHYYASNGKFYVMMMIKAS